MEIFVSNKMVGENIFRSIDSALLYSNENVTITFLDDIYFLNETIEINGKNIKFKGNNTIISGGVLIDNWKKEEDTPFWKAKSPISLFRQLYVNGRRAKRPRSEKMTTWEQYPGKYSAQDGILFDEGIIDCYSNASDIELVWETAVWRHFRHRVKEIISPNDEIWGKTDIKVIMMEQPYYAYGTQMSSDDTPKYKPMCHTPFYLENVFEFMKNPGEWYHNRKENAIYYYPFPDENIEDIEVYAPKVEVMFDITGENIEFENISFMHGSWLLPSQEGFASIQGSWLSNKAVRANTNMKGGSYVEGNIKINNAKNINFYNCTFQQLGGCAIRMVDNVRNCEIKNCKFNDISDSALQIGTVTHQTHPEKQCSNINIIENDIKYIGVEYASACAISAYYPARFNISNNKISFIPYTGISLGWGWCDKVETTVIVDNIIQNNIIHDFLMTQYDGAGIYTLGEQKNTKIVKNYIYNQHNWHAAIYLDNGSNNILVEENVMENVLKGVFVWEPSINNIIYRNNYSDTMVNVMDGTNCESVDNLFFDKGYICKNALDIIANSKISVGLGREIKFDIFYRINKTKQLPWYENYGVEANALLIKLENEAEIKTVTICIFEEGIGGIYDVYTSKEANDYSFMGSIKGNEKANSLTFESSAKVRYLCIIYKNSNPGQLGLMPIEQVFFR